MHQASQLRLVICWCILMLQNVKIWADIKLECTSLNGPVINPKTKDNPIYEKLASLQGKRYEVESGQNTYFFGICATTSAGMTGKVGSAYRSKDTSDTGNHTLGLFSNTKITAGSNWVMVKYFAEDVKCSSSLMLICNPHAKENLLMTMLEGSPDVSTECNYLFELEHSSMCVTQHFFTFSLSIGSILVITFVCVLLVYIIGGVTYNRVIRGSKGREQIPNYAFWKDFGNLQADGCNFAFRSTVPLDSRPYKGIGDDQLDEMETDDHLLPM